MKAKYKITTQFGTRGSNEIIDCFVLNIDQDSGYALIYHKPNRKLMECGSFEICKLNKNDEYVSISEHHYVNEGDKAKGLSAFLSKLK